MSDQKMRGALQTIDELCAGSEGQLAFDISSPDDEVWVYGDQAGFLYLAAALIRLREEQKQSEVNKIWVAVHRHVVEGSSLPFFELTDNFRRWRGNLKRRAFVRKAFGIVSLLVIIGLVAIGGYTVFTWLFP
ncbi:MAG: hypothetical protein SYC29_13805 [Planctomycetota bacterium]|nr:hypothetical protein [Planctomycetota bacterium]